MIVLLAHLLYEQNKEIDYSKFVSTILLKMLNAGMLSKEFALKWSKFELDSIMAEHFLFNKENNQKLRSSAQNFIEFINKSDEDESDDDSKSSSSNGESNSKSDDEE